jgi:hypothetical protein
MTIVEKPGSIFCDFCQFSAKKIGVSSKINGMFEFLSKKRQFIADFFGKLFKNHTSGPRLSTPLSIFTWFIKKKIQTCVGSHI